MTRLGYGAALFFCLLMPTIACAQPVPNETADPAPSTMVKDVLAIDLPTALKLAHARNIDLAEAQQRIRATRGDLHASIGSLLPTVGVGVGAVELEGAVAAPGGTYQVGRFSRVSPMALATWIVNPGQAIFDIIAARRRLDASKQEAEATRLAVDRDITLGFYDLALAQAHVATTTRRVEESSELARLTAAREKAGLGLTLDTQRAEAGRDAARIAAIQALSAYYAASVRLTTALDLDPAVMLVPTRGALELQTWLPAEPELDPLLAKAFLQRPDLAALRKRLGVVNAAKVSTVFAGIGPQLQANGTLANTPPASQSTDTMFRQQLYGGSATVSLSASLIGRLQGANAAKALAGLEVERSLETVRAGVITARQDRVASARALPLALAQLHAAQSAYDLAMVNLKAGTAVFHDTLSAQSDLGVARETYAEALARDSQAQARLLFAIGQHAYGTA